jgi:peptidoglycan-N-acetylglucosamine deacetylase
MQHLMTMETPKNIVNRRALGVGAAAAFLASSVEAQVVSSGPLGTAKTIIVSGSGGPKFGRKTYSETLPLSDGEVVLTFDDGPLPATTLPVLDSLAREGVKATFFLIGRNAKANPEIVRRMAAAGHTLANHTMNHPWTMRQRSFENGAREIKEGEDAIQQALGGKIAPFFRFPGFIDTPELLGELARRNNAVWGTDIWASDWNLMAPEQQLRLVMGRLRRERKGILLFHDIRAQTAQMLPTFLRALKSEGFRVVHATG